MFEEISQKQLAIYTIVKVRRFSTEYTNAFIANVYRTSKKIIVYNRMSVRPLTFYPIRHLTGVTTPFYRCQDRFTDLRVGQGVI